MFTNQSELQCSAQTSALTAWIYAYTLLVPLFIFVLFVGFQKLRSRSSCTSNYDILTINITIMEIVNVVGGYLYYSGIYSKKPLIVSMAKHVSLFSVTVQVVFYNLTCVDRYLAVVHPIMYLHLQKSIGVKVRKLCSGCTWLVSFVLVMVTYFTRSEMFQLVYMVLLHNLSIPVVCFCTASVLCILIRPGPGEGGGNKRVLDQSKRKAFNTMITTLGALLSRFICTLLSYYLFFVSNFDMKTICFVMLSVCWFGLPSSIMLPLLFLHRAKKLPKWK